MITKGRKPTQVLRDFLLRDERTKIYGSQAGLAQLIDVSESLIRAVEGDRLKLSSKLARALSSKVGVSTNWLSQDPVENLVIPNSFGLPLTYAEVLTLAQDKIPNWAVRIQQLPVPKDDSLEATTARDLAFLVEMGLLKSMRDSDCEFLKKVLELLEESGLIRAMEKINQRLEKVRNGSTAYKGRPEESTAATNERQGKEAD